MDVFDLVAKIMLDSSEYDEGLDKASGKLSGFRNGLIGGFGKIASAAGKAMAAIAKVSTAAIAGASAGVVALTKSAIDSYADYEQLVGGVETLFKESADKVQEYAANAYKTAGLSANEYMETVTSFSASLLQSLGGDTEKAAEMADMAITDMSDNANKMGTDMEMIQNAYNGFAKQNYTMLDNLKLGYGGTKEEMERLLADATALSGIEYDISSYADVVEAIHVIQTEMGITGTTAKEAAETISGSLGMLKSAWKNLVTGLADENADLDKLIDNVVESAEIAAKNIIPVAEKALSGVATLIERVVPIITEKLPDLINQVLPPLIGAATQIVVGLAKALPQIITVLLEQLPMIIEEIASALMEAAPLLAEAATNIIKKLSDFLVEAMPKIAAAIPVIVKGIVKFIIDNLPAIAQAALAIIGALAMGLIELTAELVKAGAELVMAIGRGIGDRISEIWNRVKEIGNTIKEGFFDLINRAKEWGWDLISSFISGITGKLGDLWDTIKGVGQGIKNFLGFSEPKLGPLSNFHTYAPDMMKLFAHGIRENEHLVTDQIARSFDFDVPSITRPATAQVAAEGSAEGREDMIFALLSEYLPVIAAKRLTVDSGSLARSLAPAIDEQLGTIQSRKGRESYAAAWG